MCTCVCVYVRMCIHVCVHVCADGCEGKERPGKIAHAILCHSLPCFFESRSLTEPVARLAASKPQLSPYLCLPKNTGVHSRTQLFQECL